MDYDAIVVGAGYSGITAARDLRDRGLSVLILEARDRIGGRAYTRQMRGREEMIEMGATFYDPARETHVAREVERYGVATEGGISLAGIRTIFYTGGERREGLPIATAEMGSLEEAWIKAARAAERLQGHRPLDQQWIADLDISAREFFAALDLGKPARDLITANLTPFYGDANSSSFLHYLEKIAAYGGRPWGLRGHHAKKFTNGSAALLEAMLQQSEPELRLESPAERIEREEDLVRVRVGGEEIEAAACVLAVPKTALVMERIEIDPPLDPAKQRIIGSPNQNTSYKVTFVAENLPGPIHCIGYPAPLCIIWTLAELGPGKYLCTGAGSSYAHDGDPTDPKLAEAALRHYVPDARVIASDGHNWNRDPWTGGVATIRAAGQWLGSRATLAESEGRLVFAGTDIAPSPFVNLLDGAIQSGHEAAEQVNQMLGRWRPRASSAT